MGIGDEVMVSGMVREIYAQNQRKVKVVYEKGPRWFPIWDGNPKIARPDERGDFMNLYPRSNYLRPYCEEKTAERWRWRAYRPPRGEIFLVKNERAFGELHSGAIVFAHRLKPGASPNKRWAHERWDRVSHALSALGIRMIEMGDGPPADRLAGVEFVQTRIKEAAAVISRARLVICSEGAAHHIAAAFGVPAIVIFGGYISPAVTGYDGQVSIFRGDDLGCGMRVPCAHCYAAMDSITPDEIIEAARGILC